MIPPALSEHYPKTSGGFTYDEKALSLVLVMILLFSALPMTVFAAEADDLAPTGDGYDLWLGTTQVTDANKNDILGDGSKKYIVSPTGNSGSYSIPNVARGDYYLTVSKHNHVTRQYQITVSGNLTQDVKICPLGDVDGNGKVQANDALKAYQHAQGKADAQLTDYAFLCADVAPVGKPNGKVQEADAMVIYQQAQGKHSLF